MYAASVLTGPGGRTTARIRTYGWWLMMRIFKEAGLVRLHERGLLKLTEPLLNRGTLVIRGGLGVRLCLSARHFRAWSAQAYGVLTGSHEPQVAEALRRTLPPGGVFFDVGANIGYTTLLGARLVGPDGRVVSFEPEAASAEAVRANAALNDFAQVEVVQAACAERTGEADLIVVDDSLWTRLADVGEHDLESERRRVPTVTLDDLVAAGTVPAPDVVKIDVEGAELAVIAGMTNLLTTRKPVLICEMHGKNGDFVDRMTGFGYRVVNLDGTEPVERAGGNVHALCEPRS